MIADIRTPWLRRALLVAVLPFKAVLSLLVLLWQWARNAVRSVRETW